MATKGHVLGRIWVIAFVLMCWVSPSGARADTALRGGVQLLWDAPSSCPGADDVLAAALSDDNREQAVRVRVHGVVRVQGARFELALRIQEAGPARSRVLTADSCVSLVEAGALIIAIAADAQRVEPSPSQAARVRWRVAIVSAFDAGSLPRPSAGLGGALGAKWGPWLVQAESTWWLPRRTLAVEGSRVGGRIGLVSAAVRGCFTLWSGRYVGIAPCAGIELGHSYGTGTSLSPNRQSSGLWGAALLGISLQSVGDHNYFFDVGLDAVTPWQRQRYVADGLGALFRAAPVCGRAAVRLGLSF